MAKVMTVGSFSIPHEDHYSLLSFCRQAAGPRGSVIVGVNDDDMIEERKGYRPPVADVLRGEAFVKQGYATGFFINKSWGLYHELDSYRPDILMVGSDWAHPKDYLAQIDVTFKHLWHMGIVLAFAPSLERVHSSDLRKEL